MRATRAMQLTLSILSLLLWSTWAKKKDTLIEDQIKAGLSNYCDKFQSIRSETSSVSPTTILQSTFSYHRLPAPVRIYLQLSVSVSSCCCRQQRVLPPRLAFHSVQPSTSTPCLPATTFPYQNLSFFLTYEYNDLCAPAIALLILILILILVLTPPTSPP